jgi:N-acetyl-beta-hexosaminidase
MSIITDGQVTAHALSIDNNGRVSSAAAKQEEEAEFSAALEAVNSLSRSLASSADELPQGIPPIPQPVPNKRSNQVAKAKEEGNAAFKKGASVSSSRPRRVWTQ